MAALDMYEFLMAMVMCEFFLDGYFGYVGNFFIVYGYGKNLVVVYGHVKNF